MTPVPLRYFFSLALSKKKKTTMRLAVLCCFLILIVSVSITQNFLYLYAKTAENRFKFASPFSLVSKIIIDTITLLCLRIHKPYLRSSVYLKDFRPPELNASRKLFVDSYKSCFVYCFRELGQQYFCPFLRNSSKLCWDEIAKKGNFNQLVA